MPSLDQHPMLVAFDFDGTLSDVEMIVLLAERAGCADEMAAITRRTMAGDLGFAESIRARTHLLAGLPSGDASAALDQVTLRPGADTLLAALTDADVHTAILTGGFEAGVSRALDRENVAVDEVVANRLVEEDGVLTGVVTGPLIEGTKDEVLATVAERFDVDLADTIAVGDGANDVSMLDAAGTAIGFRPKPAVRAHCDLVVATMDRLHRVLVEDGMLPV